MDKRLLEYFTREITHLRESGGEFARSFPKIAGRLTLDEFSCADPYVERLLEGFAFLAARVHLKLDSEFPRFTQCLLETVYPNYLAPIPSMAIVQFQAEDAEGSLAEGFTIPRGSAIRSVIGRSDPTACEYRTSQDVTLWPIAVVEAKYYTRELGSLDLPQVEGVKSGIRIRLNVTGGHTCDKLKLDKLTLFLRGAGAITGRLYEQIIGHTRAVVIQSTTKPVKWRHVLPANTIKQIGFDDAHALLPVDARLFQGYRLINEYFAFPERFLFFELTGLATAMSQCPDKQLDVLILMDQTELTLENNVAAANFEPFCTPAINLFPKCADRIHLIDRFSEFQVIPDRTRPLDFEIFRVAKVTGYGARAEESQDFHPFYAANDFSIEGGAYFTVNRVPRLSSEKEQRVGQRSRYAGSEVYLSLVDAKAAPYSTDLRQLGVETLCTNRDLTLFMPIGKGSTDFTLDTGAPVRAIRCVSGTPTPPKPANVEGEFAWRLISHLTLNYLSLIDNDPKESAAALRDLLKLYGDSSEATIRKQIEGVKSITSRAKSHRIPMPGPIVFARGLELTLTLDEPAFEGIGIFVFGAVMERFFKRFVSINSFTQLLIRGTERGEVMKWPVRIGQRHLA